MPERICRSVPLPSSSVKHRSLSDFFTGSHLRTLHTRMSHLANSSIVTSGSTGADLGAAAAFFAALSASSSASSLAMSMRGKSVSPFWTVTSAGSTPQTAALSHVVCSAAAPICVKAFAQLSGMKGSRSVTVMRSVSSRLYSTVARRARLLSSLARTQGAVSSIYLLAREMTLNTSMSACWVPKVSI